MKLKTFILVFFKLTSGAASAPSGGGNHYISTFFKKYLLKSKLICLWNLTLHGDVRTGVSEKFNFRYKWLPSEI